MYVSFGTLSIHGRSLWWIKVVQLANGPKLTTVVHEDLSSSSPAATGRTNDQLTGS